MPAPVPYLDHSAIDFSRPVADAAAIREVLPHRHEMELLTAIVHVDRDQELCVGYKDLGHDEFWCRGHFPGMPVMPGVLMCEAAAQICAWYALTGGFNKNQIMGLGGIDNTRFRRAVKPGERLILVGKGIRVRPRMTVIGVQGFVGDELAFHTEVIGLPIALRTEVGLA